MPADIAEGTGIIQMETVADPSGSTRRHAARRRNRPSVKSNAPPTDACGAGMYGGVLERGVVAPAAGIGEDRAFLSSKVQ
jgi:hypothetical protein